ncbi:hypothetical protein [Streptomyces mirabilis]|uniref:hypothetical protein n=1 Tax=Streptomyces mirabilis TaxID=68239 RepID=UPI0036ADF03C
MASEENDLETAAVALREAQAAVHLARRKLTAWWSARTKPGSRLPASLSVQR